MIMRILWLSHIIPYPPKSGVLIRSYHLIKEVSRYHEVDLLAFNQKSTLLSYFESVREGEAKSSEHLSQYLSEIKYYDIPSDSSAMAKYWLAIKSLFTKDPYTINWLKSDDFAVSISKQVIKKKYDLIHFDTISLAPYWNQHLKVPCVLDHHNVESHMMLRRVEHENNPLKKMYFLQEGRRLERYERNILPKFDHHIVCSKDDELRLLMIDKSLNTTVIPNGISMSCELPRRTPVNPARLLFIGGLNWYPNRDAIHYFLELVWPRISNQSLEVNVDIIGKHPSKKIRRYAESDSRITVHGYVDDIAGFYERASIYICPIRDGGGTKLKILDALAHKLPVVADRIACEGLDIVDGIHALLSQDPQQMADNILFLLQNPQVAFELEKNGYELVRRLYDFSSIGVIMSDLYSSLVNEVNRKL